MPSENTLRWIDRKRAVIHSQKRLREVRCEADKILEEGVEVWMTLTSEEQDEALKIWDEIWKKEYAV